LALVLELDRPLRPGERLLEGADLLAVLLVLLELDRDDRASLGRRAPRAVWTAGPWAGAPQGRSASSSPAALVARRVKASSRARWTVDLPASFGPRMTVRPGA